MNNDGVAKYIVRYIGRPVMAQSRIIDYDGQNVTYWYQPHGSDEIVTETISAIEFIRRLIIHIPDRNFKMLRYYGLYSTKSKKHGQYLRLLKRMTNLHRNTLEAISKSWRKRIIYFFHYDPIKCPCGHYYEIVDCYSPRKSSAKFTPARFHGT